jgi:hypothetical protein
MGSEPPTEEAVIAFVRESLGLMCERLTPLRGGRNSRVFLAECVGETQMVVKAYPSCQDDPRERLKTEWDAFVFLKRQGVSWVPAPLYCDTTRQMAIYESIQGEPPLSAKLHSSDIQQAVNALGTLFELGQGLPETRERFAPASEACFSIESVFESLDSRFAILTTCAEGSPQLHTFLQGELLPFQHELRAWCEATAHKTGVRLAERLPREARTLSPSDFGFHNALRRSKGELVFLDFEYFGWDDPAKTVVDFLLHPAMQLTLEQQQEFLAQCIAAFRGVENLYNRIKLVFPLFGVKWCCILLNEFTRCHLQRRVFSGSASSEANLLDQKKITQLSKARAMLGYLQNAYLRFP